VSAAFNLLKVSEVKRKKTNTVRQRLPKSLSGKGALRILQEKEEKKSDEEPKEVLRMEKKLQKLEEKEKKSKLRQEAKK